MIFTIDLNTAIGIVSAVTGAMFAIFLVYKSDRKEDAKERKENTSILLKLVSDLASFSSNTVKTSECIFTSRMADEKIAKTVLESEDRLLDKIDSLEERHEKRLDKIEKHLETR